MTIKRKQLIYIIIFLAIVAIGMAYPFFSDGYFKPTNQAEKQTEALGAEIAQKCPEAWIKDSMPKHRDDDQPTGVSDSYWIIDGKKVEDLPAHAIAWIKMNCPINEPTDAQ